MVNLAPTLHATLSRTMTGPAQTLAAPLAARDNSHHPLRVFVVVNSRTPMSWGLGGHPISVHSIQQQATSTKVC